MPSLNSVEKNLSKSDGLNALGIGPLFSEVRVFDGNGKLKKTITTKTLLETLYRTEGLASAPFPSIAPETKYGKGVCAYCKNTFDKTSRLQKYCKHEGSTDQQRNKCYAKAYQKRLTREKVDHICKRCQKPFKGTKGRVYCNTPYKDGNGRCDSEGMKVHYELPESRDCRLCKLPFKPKTNTNTYCNSPCNFNLQREVERNIRRNLKDGIEISVIEAISNSATTQPRHKRVARLPSI